MLAMETGITSVAFSSDGQLALTGGNDTTLKLWDIASGRDVRTFVGHKAAVNSVAFSPDDKLVLSGSGDDTLKLWEMASGREVRTFVGHSGFVQVGRLLARWQARIVRSLWRAQAVGCSIWSPASELWRPRWVDQFSRFLAQWPIRAVGGRRQNGKNLGCCQRD